MSQYFRLLGWMQIRRRFIGKHYVPQHYLNAFADPRQPKMIWMFDKQTGQFVEDTVSIKQVAQERDFYDPEIEKQITTSIEIPGNAVLDKLRSKNFDLTDEDRVYLSVYIASLIYRVPKRRAKAHSIAPKALAEVTGELRALIQAHANAGNISNEVAKARLAETDAVEAKYLSTLPPEVVEQIRNPFPKPNIVELVYEMHWRYVLADSTQFCLTSDNPAFFFEGYGLGSEESELTFPISPEIVLFGCWTPVHPTRRVVRRTQFVKEANRRVACGAFRFVFNRAKANWIERIAAKPETQLSRIRW